MTTGTEATPIHNISDTALWIAAYRAQETERTDAAFKDPFAGILAGEHGMEIAAAMPHTHAMAYAMVMRTSAIDRMVLQAIEKGIDTVINIGAGLDTRPYRLPLPANLRWIEIDFEHMLQYKQEKLQGETPVCRLERIAADLSQEKERLALFQRLGNETEKALIITEGLIGYLTNAQAANLSKDIISIPSFRYWIMDYAQGALRRNRQIKDVAKKMTNAPLQFHEKNPLGFFRRDGWRVSENLGILDEAERIGREFPKMFPWSLLMTLFPKAFRKLGNKTYGYVMFEQN